MPKRAGRKSKAQTPAPRKERIYGSKKNPKGSAASEKSASKIKLDEKTMTALKNKLKEFKEKHPNKKNITLNDLKAVYRRGAGAYSKSHRPTITGGAPNTRNAWSMARVNKFLLKAGGTKVKAAYVQDDDLMKMAKGGEILGIKYTISKGESDDERIVTFEEGQYRDIQIEPHDAIFHKTWGRMGGEGWAHIKEFGFTYPTIREAIKSYLEDKRGKKYPIVTKKKGGITLLAPNGKPSNLNSEQWHLVRTPQFKAWFGDWENDPQNASKVVDENREPLVVYHGTKDNFTIFDLDKVGKKTDTGMWGKGFYFSSNKKYSETYANKSYDYKTQKKLSTDGYIFDVFLSLKNPYIINNQNDIPKINVPNEKMEDLINADKLYSQKFRKTLIDKGYDGVFVKFEFNFSGNYPRDYELVAFEPNQIKLANGSNKTFDSNSNDIRYEEGGEIKLYEYKDEDEHKITFDFVSNNRGVGKLILTNDPLYDLGFDNVFEIRLLYVDKDYRGEGIAKQLIKSAIKWAKDNNVDWLISLIHVRSDSSLTNKQMFGFLKRYGFEYIDTKYNSDILGLRIKEVYDKGGFIAPNGKPTNLTAEQYKLVRTPQFKAWFGDWENDPDNASKVVDENGEPLVVYRSVSPKPLAQGYNPPPGSWNYSREGYQYFAKNKDYSRLHGHITKEFFLNIRNILDFNYYNEILIANGIIGYGRSEGIFTISDELENEKPYLAQIGRVANKLPELAKEIRSNLKNVDGFHGYEAGQYGEQESYVVLEPQQIKLADGTNTTFDPNLPDSRFAIGGSTDEIITCKNCGWSWNESQTTPSEKYICHKCGFDNEPNDDYAKGGQTFNDKELLAKWKRGESIGFTATAHLKAKGLIPRSDGTKRKSPQYKKEGGLVGGFEDLTDEWLSKKIEIFLNKVKPIKFYFVDPNTNTLTIGFDKYYSQDAAQKVYEEATSSKEFFHAPSVESTYDSKTGDLVFKIKLKKVVEYNDGGEVDKFTDRFGKNKFVNLDRKDIDDFAPSLLDLIKTAYGHIGGHFEFSNVDEFKKTNLDYWVATDVDDDPDADALIGGKTTQAGTKITVGGQDGSKVGKIAMIRKTKELLEEKGFYTEMDKELAQKIGVEPIKSLRTIKKVLGKDDIEYIGKGLYSRNISGHKKEKVLVGIPKKFAKGGEVDEKVIKERWAKKKDSLMNMADNIRSLRTNLRKDLKGDDDKDRLTALAISLMDKTAERVGNNESEANGHLGITGLSKRNVKVEGNTITLKYIGKSGVKHEKQFSDEGIATALKDAIANSQSKYVFETSDGFRIKNDRINRYLGEYDISAKDLRGYSANQWIVSKLREVKDKEILGDEAKRKKKFNEIVKSVAEKVGHGAPTLKKHYMLPALEREWVNNGKIVDLANIKRAFKDGGEIDEYKQGGVTTKYALKKGGDVGVADINQGANVLNNIDYDPLDETQDIPNDGEGVFDKGGALNFNDIVLYHEKNGNWFVPKNTVYAWLYQDPNAAKKLESGEFDFVLFPPNPPMSLAMSRGYVPPLLKIWTKKYQKETKGADNLLGIVKGWYDEENKKLYIIMMTTRKDMRRKGVNSHIIKNLREEFNLDKDQIVFDKPTKEGEMFSKSGKYNHGGKVDLFEHYDELPKKVQAILEKYENEEPDYTTLESLQGELEEQGYTFEYGLDYEPYGLRKMAKGGEISDEEKKETYKKWKSLVNMSKSELEKFYNSEEGKVAGLTASQAKSQGIDSGRESARWIMKMKDTSVKNWTPTMWKWAKKQISFISRMSGNKGKLYDESGAKTRKHTSLLIWGHNPTKKAGGGELDIPIKENAMNEVTYNQLPAINDLGVGKKFVLKEHYYNNQNGKPTHQGCRYLIVENMGDAQMSDCLKLKVHHCYGGGGVTTMGIITRPIKNIMNKGRDMGESLASGVEKAFKKGGELDPDKKEVKQYFEHKSGAAGGLLVGKRHSEGGIQAINKSTGQPLEMEGGEVVITRDAVSDSTLHDFNGKQMTNREILSAINESGGGVKFAEGGDVSCLCSGKEYKLGGKTYKDYELFKKINNSYGSKSAIEKGMKVEDKEHGETFRMLKNGEITYEQFLKKLVVDHLSENPKYYDK